MEQILSFFTGRFNEIVGFMSRTKIFGSMTLLGWYLSIMMMTVILSFIVWLLLPWKGYLNPSNTYISSKRYDKAKDYYTTKSNYYKERKND